MTSLSANGFLHCLFTELERHQLRYCVLHGYRGLPDELSSDLDMALHPSDVPKLGPVFDGLRGEGYQPLQSIHYSAGSGGSHYFVFGWFENGEFRSAAIDFTCEHREGGVILMSAEDLLRARQRSGPFWVPGAATEFRYLLAKKIMKGAINPAQLERLAFLTRQLGRETAGEVAAQVVGEANKTRVIDACLNGTLSAEIGHLRRRIVRALWIRDPLNRVRYFATEAPRLLRRMVRPTGLVVAVLGPDGVGKSTLLPLLQERIGGLFRRHRLFHWKPQLLRGGKAEIVPDPHARPCHPPLRSIAQLLGHAFDFILGYWLIVYPARVQSGLAIFDRHFDDLMVDPKRYRYGGPLWVPRLLRFLIPKPDVLLVLEASGDAVRSRKQELEHDEIVRQGGAYRDLVYRSKSACVIDATGPREVVAERAAKAIADHLSARFNRTHRLWPQPFSGEGSAHLNEAARWLGGETEFGDGRTFSKSQGKQFAIVPSRREPRWIIPLQNGGLSLAAMRMCTPYTSRARLFKNLCLVALKLSWARLPGDVISVLADGASPLEELVRDTVGEPHPVFGISFGTSGRHRKLTVQVMTASGEVLAYIKIPMTNTGSDRVRHEASVLRTLATYPVLEKHIPRLLFAGAWQDRYILIEDALQGPGGPARLTTAHFSFLQTLWGLQPIYRYGEDIVDEVASDWKAIGGRLDSRWNQLAAEALYVAKREIGGIEVPCGITHGDFAPWNTRTKNGNLGVFDWECARWSQPIWWDIFHFETQSSTLLKHTPRQGVPGADHPTFQTIHMMYLLSSTCRILSDEPSVMNGLQYRREILAAQLLRHAGARVARGAKPLLIG